jgi:hypothetical protein
LYQSIKYLLNLTLLVVCSQFVFADDANTDGKQMYISFEDAQAALPDKHEYEPQDPVTTRDTPDWEDDPGGYEFVAVMTAAVSMKVSS